jgi:hypothetical protein
LFDYITCGAGESQFVILRRLFRERPGKRVAGIGSPQFQRFVLRKLCEKGGFIKEEGISPSYFCYFEFFAISSAAVIQKY